MVVKYFRYKCSHNRSNRNLHVGFINDGNRKKGRHNLLIYAVTVLQSNLRHNCSHSSCKAKLTCGLQNGGKRNRRRHNLLIYATINDT